MIDILIRPQNWPNHATSDHQDSKNTKISNIFTKIALFRARIR